MKLITVLGIPVIAMVFAGCSATTLSTKTNDKGEKVYTLEAESDDALSYKRFYFEKVSGGDTVAYTFDNFHSNLRDLPNTIDRLTIATDNSGEITPVICDVTPLHQKKRGSHLSVASTTCKFWVEDFNKLQYAKKIDLRRVTTSRNTLTAGVKQFCAQTYGRGNYLYEQCVEPYYPKKQSWSFRLTDKFVKTLNGYAKCVSDDSCEM